VFHSFIILFVLNTVFFAVFEAYLHKIRILASVSSSHAWDEKSKCRQVQEEGINWLQHELCLQQEVRDFNGLYLEKK
jgi:hypothetical protein